MAHKGPEHWYVYYSVAAADRDTALRRVQAMQASLTSATGVHARLEERIDAGRALTWMEVYERVTDPDEFGRLLSAALETSELPGIPPNARHIERFKVL